MAARAPIVNLLIAACVGVILALLPHGAFACSAGFDFNPARESEVILAGRVTDMELAPSIPSRGPVPQTQAVWLTFSVDRYLKGTGPTELRAVDTSSVTFFNGQTPEQMARFEGAQYEGAGGACGALTADPRGRYFVIGLSRVEGGPLRTNLLLTFGVGDGPDDPRIVEALARAQAALAVVPRPGATGHGAGAALASRGPAVEAASLAATLALVILARFAARSPAPVRWRHGPRRGRIVV